MRVYSNSSSLHNVSKVEMVEGYGDGVRKIVIHQAVAPDMRAVLGNTDGHLVLKHEITVHPVKETTVTPISVTPIAMEVS